MFDIARDPKVWERIRNDEAFARHRKELTEAYDKFFAVAPSCASAWEVLDYPNVHGRGGDSFRQLQCVAILALIYPENEKYYDIMKLGYPEEAELIDFFGDECLYSDINGNLYSCSFD